jgi:hypothetical protein
MKQKLKNLAFTMEQIRSEVERSIFPRDENLRIIEADVQKPSSNPGLLIVKKDLFTAYETCLGLHNLI